MTGRLDEAGEALKFWQQKLNLQDWDLRVELTEFKRTDYIQTGDFKVEAEKKAVILISKNPTDKDIKQVVLHEIIHVLLWDFDHYCESKIAPSHRAEYLNLLESTVATLTKTYF